MCFLCERQIFHMYISPDPVEKQTAVHKVPSSVPVAPLYLELLCQKEGKRLFLLTLTGDFYSNEREKKIFFLFHRTASCIQ